MDIHVSVGEWMASLKNRMENAKETDCFHLPTHMHLHAFMILKEELFTGREFRVEVKQ
jgi:hypothetical protein